VDAPALEVTARGAVMKRLVLAALCLAGCRDRTSYEVVHVAAASEMTDVLNQVARQFEAQTHIKVVLTFGASGLLARQLNEGGPFDVFASASDDFVSATVAAGVCDGTTKQHLSFGRLAVLSTTPLTAIRGLAQLPGVKIALANPEHAPYGRAAKQALEHERLWTPLAGRLVYAANVRQALEYFDSGEVDVAFVAWSNVALRDAGHSDLLLVDEALHAPLEHTLVLCRGGHHPEAARSFAGFLRNLPPGALEPKLPSAPH
jgi:molybdate transport system substrate-binding protein